MSILIKSKITQKCRKIYNLSSYIFAYSFLRLLFVVCLILFSLSYYLVLNHVTIFIAFDFLTVNFSFLALIFFFCKHCLASNSLASCGQCFSYIIYLLIKIVVVFESDFGRQGWIGTLGLKQIFFEFSVYLHRLKLNDKLQNDDKINKSWFKLSCYINKQLR